MSSKIKVDTIENVAGSGNVSLGSGHNLVVPGNNSTTGNATVGGTLGVTGTSALTGNTTVGGTLGVTGTATLSGNATIGTNSGDTRFSLNSANQYTMVLKNAGNIAGQIGGGGADDLRFSNAAGATTMQIKDGRVFKPLQVSFIAAGGTGSYINTSPIQFPTVHQNVGNGYNNSNHTFTAPVGGTYLFHLHLGLTQGHNNNQLYPYMAINGANTVYTYQAINASTAHSNAHITQMFALSANDTVKINFVYGSSSGKYYGNTAECRFMGYLLG